MVASRKSAFEPMGLEENVSWFGWAPQAGQRSPDCAATAANAAKRARQAGSTVS